MLGIISRLCTYLDTLERDTRGLRRSTYRSPDGVHRYTTFERPGRKRIIRIPRPAAQETSYNSIYHLSGLKLNSEIYFVPILVPLLKERCVEHCA